MSNTLILQYNDGSQYTLKHVVDFREGAEGLFLTQLLQERFKIDGFIDTKRETKNIMNIPVSHLAGYTFRQAQGVGFMDHSRTFTKSATLKTNLGIKPAKVPYNGPALAAGPVKAKKPLPSDWLRFVEDSGRVLLVSPVDKTFSEDGTFLSHELLSYEGVKLSLEKVKAIMAKVAEAKAEDEDDESLGSNSMKEAPGL